MCDRTAETRWRAGAGTAPATALVITIGGVVLSDGNPRDLTGVLININSHGHASVCTSRRVKTANAFPRG
eukprot:4618940-Prymnesium_polylepis.1